MRTLILLKKKSNKESDFLINKWLSFYSLSFRSETVAEEKKVTITTLILFSLNKLLRRKENKCPNMVVGNVAGLCLTLSLFHFNGGL